jgi:hypothetical protein
MEKPEEKTSEPIETADGGVQVSIEEEPQEEAKVEVKEEKPKAKPDPEASFRNKVYAQERIISKLQKDIEELKVKPSYEPEPKPTESLDEIDKLAQADWKAAVRKLSAQEIQTALAQERKKMEEQSQVFQVQQMMDRNAEMAISKHPELNDELSEKRQVFNQVLENNPRWRLSPDGPLLAMYAMEDELRKQGYDLGDTKNKKEDERNRLMRVSASSLPASKEVPSTGKITLTREQREFCDTNGMTYEQYARTLSKSGDKTGVEA